jgi:hypothetical protein
MGAHLGVEVDIELFQESHNMNELLLGLSDCKRRFLIPESVCRKYKFNLEWSVATSRLSRVIALAYGFIMNYPSDRNILGITHE